MQFGDFNFLPYSRADELWVITVYYNPCGYASRKTTYDSFIQAMNLSGIKVLTIECAFGNDSFQLPDSPLTIQIRSKSLLWQKERLINIGASYLPSSCRYVAWIDCDVIFKNKFWAEEACSLLSDKATVVQLWQTCLRLEKGDKVPADPKPVESFASVTSRDISTLDCGRYDMHGHTGYAWAMRREIFDELGLYEYAVSGSSDHFMAHAVYGQYGFCIENALKHDPRQICHFKCWGNMFFEQTQGKLSAVSGEILHLWHGNLTNRNYFGRMWRITEFGFNPDTDLLALPGRTLEWQSHVVQNKPRLVSYFAEYFASRQEDSE